MFILQVHSYTTLQLVTSKNYLMQEHYNVSLPALKLGTETLLFVTFCVTWKEKALIVDITKSECNHKHLTIYV
jgi:hypothetical protein